MPYSPLLIRPMREELTSAGFTELRTAADVDAPPRRKAGRRRSWSSIPSAVAPPVERAPVRVWRSRSRRGPTGSRRSSPDRISKPPRGACAPTSARFRRPSPSMGLFKDGELVWFLPRHRIEGRDALAVAADLRAAFAAHCAPVPVAG